MVGRSGTSVDGTTVKLLEGSDSDVLSEVDESSDGGYRNASGSSCSMSRNEGLTRSDVEPVLVVGSELLVSSGLDEIDPGRDLELTYVTQQPR